ncbi:MFS transporter [Streptomyces sp. NBC_00258]|uniref:MFS transporter n=1 Tax=Streptomyces sp. NBC_00258 TaxID=2903642 RepID=UPI002E29145F|nr:MFS transporter [Streptomyces sp. NBC_00258]
MSDAPVVADAPAHVAHRAARACTKRRTASFALDVSILAALLAASSAPTPLYPLYQDQWGLSALAVTVVFSAYALALLLALLTTGALSDHLGRRPVLAGALLMAAASMVLLASADGAGSLTIARVLQGAATGAATSAAGAALLDLENPRRPGRSALANSVTPVAGMATGVLVSTLLVRFAPAPTVTVYVLLAALSSPRRSRPPSPRRRPTATRERCGRCARGPASRPRSATPCWPRAPLSAPSGRWAASTPPSARPSYAWWPPTPRKQPAAWSSSPSAPPPRSPYGRCGAGRPAPRRSAAACPSCPPRP